MYTEIYMDIGNKCNALCPYCKTGKNNINGVSKKIPTYFMDVEQFERLAKHLVKHKIITKDAWFRIYNWYEPTLNPHFPEIINYMYDNGFKVDLSTNASVLPDFSRIKSCEHYEGILFSMPGFSQASYDKMHKFDFEIIKNNIRTTMKTIREKGFKGDAYINYHLYQFNIGEVYAAKAFADEMGIRLHCIFAYFNGSGESVNYLKGTLSSKELKSASKDLFFYYLDELFENQDKYLKLFKEPESITLSEFCNVIPGRGSNDEEAIVSIFDLYSYEDVKKVYEDVTNERAKNPYYYKAYLWGHSYKRSMNHLFGF